MFTLYCIIAIEGRQRHLNVLQILALAMKEPNRVVPLLREANRASRHNPHDSTRKRI